MTAFRQAFRVKQNDDLLLHFEHSLRFERFQSAAQYVPYGAKADGHFI